MSANSESFPPPNNPDDFESLCLDLWKDIWGDPGAQKNARSGQPQAGVDVFGQLNGGWIGVQCKQKDGQLRTKVTVTELDREVCEALKFNPKLSAFILATSGPADAKVQERARKVTEKHRNEGLFNVEIWSWERIWHELYGRGELLRRIGPVYWSRHWQLVEEAQRQRGRGKSALHGNVPNPPPHCLLRLEAISELRRLLLDADSSPVGIIGQAAAVGVQGMGGIGKTVLAAAIARDAEIQKTFADGVFWLTVGQKPNALALMNQLANCLPNSEGPFASEAEAASALWKAFENKQSLVILDDVWDFDVASSLNIVSGDSRLLFTTRNRELNASLSANEFCLGVLDLPEALTILAHWTGVKAPSFLPPEAADVARECGGLPLALAMIGAMLRPGATTTWTDVLDMLRSRELEEFRRAFPNYPYPDLLRSIAVSVDDLPEEDRKRYLDLAVFPEDEPIVESALQLIWGLSESKTRGCIDRLSARSLATILEAKGKAALLLHDLQRDYIHKQREQNLPALHKHLIDAYAEQCRRSGVVSPNHDVVNWSTGPNDGYYFQRLAWHFKNAGQCDQLRSLLLDFDWLQARLSTTSVVELLEDFPHVTLDEELRLLQGAIRLSAHALATNPAQLAGQIIGRLNGCGSPGIERLEEAAKRTASGLIPIHRTLRPPESGLIQTFHGHTHPVTAVAVFARCQQALSGDKGGNLKIWDLQTGRELNALTPHAGAVNATAVSVDGIFAVSASEDYSLAVWDLRRGEQLFRLKGHHGVVSSLVITADSKRAISGGADGQVILWCLRSGTEIGRLSGHQHEINALALGASGRLAVTASEDGMLKVWDLEAQQELRTIKAHEAAVTAVAANSQGTRIASGSSDYTVRVWDMKTGSASMLLEGHESVVSAVQFGPDGRQLVSADWKGVIKLWDSETGNELRMLESELSQVNSLAVAEHGWLAVSGHEDQTLRLWDLRGGDRDRVYTSGSGRVIDLALGDRGRRAILAYGDGAIETWDVPKGSTIDRFELQPAEPVDRPKMKPAKKPGWWQSRQSKRDRACAWAVSAILGSSPKWQISLLESGSLAAVVTPEKELIIWDFETRSKLRTLRTKVGLHSILAVSSDNEWIAAHDSHGPIYVWNLRAGKEFQIPYNGEEGISCLWIDPRSHRMISGHQNGMVKIWDFVKRHEVSSFRIHTECIRVVMFANDGLLGMSAGDDALIKKWDPTTGQELCAFTGHRNVVASLGLTLGETRAVSASWDHTVKLWDFRTGRCLGTFQGENAISACVVSPEGKIVVAVEDTGRIHFLQVGAPHSMTGVV
jgi:WD40 repeat protein